MNPPAMNRETSGACRVGVALAERSYEVLVGQGLLDDAAAFASLRPGAHAVIVTNDVVGPLFAARASRTLQSRFSRISTVTLADGEANKRWETLNDIFDALIAEHSDRSTTLIALGGGVVGDVTGFAAACYMRGIDYVQVPTTLLAQVDSSVGGKTAINHPAGKNMIGAFHQPRLVVADVDTLSTLPRRELIAGLAEVIKYGAAVDAAFLGWLEDNLSRLLALEGDALVYAVRRSCELKAAIVAADERESGRRAVLNFGHTFAHAIEAGVGYGQWLHGEAVGCGMVLASRLSERMGLISHERASRLQGIIERAGLPIRPPDVDAATLVQLMRADKKSIDGRQRFVLLEGADGAVLAPAPEDLVERVLRDSGLR
jgi:3-dehydroquinate synthase